MSAMPGSVGEASSNRRLYPTSNCRALGISESQAGVKRSPDQDFLKGVLPASVAALETASPRVFVCSPNAFICVCINSV